MPGWLTTSISCFRTYGTEWFHVGTENRNQVAVVSRTRATRVVDDLVVAGLVERMPDPDDRRSVVLAG
jgi:MarR family